jgi:hypothetical protein
MKGAQPSLAHVSNLFSLIVHAPYRAAALLFGPNGERGWNEGGDWDPHFFYPQPGEDVPGAVFAIQRGSKKMVWVNTAFDIEARHFQYVYFVPEVLVTTIDVNFVPLDAGSTKVSVVYTRTALDSAANEHVRELGESDRKSGEHWERAINDYLAKRKH